MKKHLICTILILIFIFSMGTISAQDINDTAQSIDDENGIVIADSDLPSNSPKSFKDLENDLPTYYDNVSEFNISDDYAYNEETDSNMTPFDLMIGGFDFTINGNNHFIDGKNRISGFMIFGGNITIKDLTFINCNESWINGMGTTVNLNNVKFIDNGTDGNQTLIKIVGSNLTVKNCSFYSTTKHKADIVGALISSVSVEDSTFLGGRVDYGRILVPYGCNLYVNNATFTNSSARYAPAIYCEGLQWVIRNSKFINLSSDLSSGAIGFKFPHIADFNQTPLFLIENCIFENTSSTKDAGAVFFDSLGMLAYGALYENLTLDIINSTFKNCSSNFGGAILHLYGNLNIADSTFMNNKATSSGGAIYTSCTNLNISNSTLTNNVADYQAGAIFFDEGNLTISNSKLIGNKVTYSAIKNTAHTIYAYDANMIFEDSLFNNSGVSVVGFFSDLKDMNTTFLNDELSTNNTEYEYFVARYAMPIELVNNTIDVDGIPSKFDLRDWGWAGNVYNQGNNGACWAVGSVGALESALLKATGVQHLFSPNNMQNMELIYSKYGSTAMIEGGYVFSAPGYLLSWLGLQSSEIDPYDEMGKISELIFDDDETIHVQDVIVIPGRTDTTDIELKKAILNYGALAIIYGAHGDTEPYFNSENGACYYNESHSANHLIDVVGWDDNYSKDNFIITPPGDGAWICKNSWGTGTGDGGFIYLSYYDMSFLYLENMTGLFSGAVGYIFNNTIPYTINYQTDFAGLGYFDGNYTHYSNEFISQTYELLGAVGTYFNETGVDYELKIYVNDELIHTQTGTSEYAGFKTIILDKYVPVILDDKIKVEFKSNSVPIATQTRQHLLANVSFVSADGENWIDALDFDSTVCLKAYTVDDDTKIIDNENITVYYNSGSYFSVKVVTADGRPVGAGERVKFTIGEKTTTARTDNDGIAKIEITEEPGTYVMTTTTFNGDTYTNTITVISNSSNDNNTPDKGNESDDKSVPDIKPTPSSTMPAYSRQSSYNSEYVYTLYRADDMKVICRSNVVILKALMDLFKVNLTNGHLKVYIDGVLVFDGDVDDNLSKVIFEILEKFLGKHEITVEFTDSEGKTQTYNETMIIE
ncbi:hypothetical protein TL18_04285 [Methanobrevibacter sp. YE315]|uniref:C1 family peptidase n=1 Tax=Methanobrevibacter sp. YE315 TaxID=1609968 RepID=UPI000764E7D0|nr:C1 family peptidase [Methanobrevibacter sp. YE315]AMD17308.1 hypothetical protein TL18_04285 [Methanobrevibacter sp. YE315]